VLQLLLSRLPSDCEIDHKPDLVVRSGAKRHGMNSIKSVEARSAPGIYPALCTLMGSRSRYNLPDARLDEGSWYFVVVP